VHHLDRPLTKQIPLTLIELASHALILSGALSTLIGKDQNFTSFALMRAISSPIRDFTFCEVSLL
jgi:hypothetical protein